MAQETLKSAAHVIISLYASGIVQQVSIQDLNGIFLIDTDNIFSYSHLILEKNIWGTVESALIWNVFMRIFCFKIIQTIPIVFLRPLLRHVLDVDVSKPDKIFRIQMQGNVDKK